MMPIFIAGKNKESGYTFIDVVIALLIIGLAVAPLISGISSFSKNSQKIKNEIIAYSQRRSEYIIKGVYFEEKNPE